MLPRGLPLLPPALQAPAQLALGGGGESPADKCEMKTCLMQTRGENPEQNTKNLNRNSVDADTSDQPFSAGGEEGGCRACPLIRMGGVG